MIGLPEFGQRVRVWPFPGRRAQRDERPVDRWGGGAYLPKSGEVVIWSHFHYEQLLYGALLLHPPPCDTHDFGDPVKGGKYERDNCQHCGRTVQEGQQYDVHFAQGAPPEAVAAERDARKAMMAGTIDALFNPHEAQARDMTAGALDKALEAEQAYLAKQGEQVAVSVKAASPPAPAPSAPTPVPPPLDPQPLK